MAKFDSGLYHGTLGSPQGWLVFDPRPRDPGLPAGPGSPPDRPDKPEGPVSARDALLAEAKTPEAKEVVNQLYRPNADYGDGGTADAIRRELATGKPVHGKSHIKKGRQRLAQINRILRRNPDHPDRALRERLRDDLRDALGGN